MQKKVPYKVLVWRLAVGFTLPGDSEKTGTSTV